MADKYHDLVQAAKNGDTAPLVDQCLPLLWAIIKRRVPRQDIDDVVQNALYRTLTALISIKDHERFNAWLNRVANSAIVNHWRDHYRHNMESLPDKPDSSSLHHDGTRPYDIVMRKEEYERLWKLVEELPKHKSEAIRRFYIDQQTTEQIAIEVGRNHNTVRRWMTEAREMLKERLS